MSRLMSISSRARKRPSAGFSIFSSAKRTDNAIAVNFASLKYVCGLTIFRRLPSGIFSEISKPIKGSFNFLYDDLRSFISPFSLTNSIILSYFNQYSLVSSSGLSKFESYRNLITNSLSSSSLKDSLYRSEA